MTIGKTDSTRGMGTQRQAPSSFNSKAWDKLASTLQSKATLGKSPPAPRVLVAQANIPGANDSVGPPTALRKFDQPIKNYSASELQAAATTVFGEISAGKPSAAEAKAIASTIFNRKQSIDTSRAEFNRLQQELEKASKIRDAAEAKYDNVSKYPSKYKAALMKQGLSSAAAAAQVPKDEATLLAQYNQASRAYSAAQKALGKASSEKLSMNQYLGADKQSEERVTLEMIVEPDEQYKGTTTGKGYFANYSNYSESDKASLARRWELARNAVESLANGTSKADNFLQFRSNSNGKRTLAPNETRIGGNDFWK